MPHIPTDVRRQQFIDAAVKVIAREGADGATTRRIAEEAGAPLATLHYCFQTKANLLWAVFEQLAQVVREDAADAGMQGHGTGEIASRLVTRAIEWAIARPEANRAQFEIWLWASRNDPELAARIHALFVSTWVEFLRAASAPLPDDQLETVAQVVVSLVDGLCMQLVGNADEHVTRTKIQAAMEMLEISLGH